MLVYLPVIIWLIPWYFFFRIASRKPALRQFSPRSGRPLSVIIPARNEAAGIERCVRSILTSTYTPLEVLVVDDRSTDTTAEIVAGIAREDSRLKLVRGKTLPDGWYGKPWACVQGYRAATGELLCFTDADTTHGPGLLPLSVGASESLEAALFTVMPAQLCLTWSERLILPQFFYLLAAKYHPAAINAATDVKDMIANGQFILISREWYERVGTHESVKQEVAEDLAIGQEVFALGGKVRMVYALEQMSTRMYTDWAHLREGFSKNLFLGARRSLQGHPVLQWIVPYLVGITFLIWLAPPVVLLLQAFGVQAWATGPALAATSLSFLFWVFFDLGIGIPIYYAFAYPLGALGAFDIALLSAVRGKRRVEWKGRTYGTGGTTTGS